MKGSLSNLTGLQPQRGRRLWRNVQRFMTGITLGMILALASGWLTPLMAQSHEWVAETMTAQGLPALLDAVDEEAASDDAPADPIDVPTPPVIPTDIETHWAANCIRELAQRQALPLDQETQLDSTDPENAADSFQVSVRFYPDAPATWSVVTEILNQSFPTVAAYAGANPVEAALKLPSAVNVLYSFPSRYYAPNRPATRAEAVTALAAKAALPYTTRANELLNASLTDGAQIAAYGREAVASAIAARVLVNYPDAQSFEGNRPITRGELAALVCKARPESVLRASVSSEWVALPQELSPQRQPDTEVRGVWLTNIDSDVLFSKDNLAEGIQRLKALNINTLYPVVWNMGYPQFPSRIAEVVLGQDRRLWPGDNPQFEQAQGDRDMLAEIIELAHGEGMAVIPWFEFGFMAPADYALLETHPDWFTQRLDGTREIYMGEEVFTWMNPFHPQPQRLLLTMMAEVLKNYDVDGIQVDDHLGMPVDMGYDPYTIDLYQQDNDGELPPEDPYTDYWVRWRADRISEFMAKVRLVIDQRKPDAILSVSPNPYPFSYVEYLQDWPTWAEAGLLDEIIIQVYRDDLDRFVWELNKPATVAASQQTPTSIGLLSGLRGRPTDADLLAEQLTAVRDRGFAGVSYFFYQTLWDPGKETLEEREAQFKDSFSEAVSRP